MNKKRVLVTKLLNTQYTLQSIYYTSAVRFSNTEQQLSL